MSWLLAIGLAAAAFVLMAFVMKVPASMRLAIGAALVLGLAGYALQASPDLPGAPKAAAQDKAKGNAAIVEARQQLSANGSKQLPDDQWMIIGDALARRGQFGDAAGIYLGAVEKTPRNAEAWLALANVLVAHADGTLSPAAALAFRRAGEAAPNHPGPPYFFGLALAQSGRLEEARNVWALLLQATPQDAPWRPELAEKLNRLDQMIQQRQRK